LNTLSRYVLREHFWPFCLGFSLIIFVLLMDVVLQMMDQVLSKGLTLLLAAQLLLFNLAWIVALAVPMAVLMAVLMAFARLASDNEIMAAKGCGVGFYNLLRPVLAAAAILTVLMVFFNDYILPDWNHRARNIASGLRRRKAALVLKEKEGIFIHGLENYSLLVRQIDEKNNRLHGITVYDTRAPGPPTTLHAPSGQIQLFGDGSYIRLTLEDGEFYRIDDDDPDRFFGGSFHRQIVHIEDPQRAFKNQNSGYRSDREMGIAAMRRTVAKRRLQRQQHIQQMDSTIQAVIASLEERGASLEERDASLEGRSDSTAFEREQEVAVARQRLEKQLRQVDNHTKRINEFEVEIHKKFSIPVACLVFVLIGAPLGVAIRRRGAAVSVGISLGFFWIYWMFLIGGEELADRGFVPPAVAMWAPNILFGLLGIYMTRLTLFDRPWLSRLRRRWSP
jgi:lipopolysaccharide export system permease protein